MLCGLTCVLTDDNTLHGSGRRIENASEGVTIQIEKKQESDENLNIYLYIIQDAQINFEDGRFKEVVYKNASHASHAAAHAPKVQVLPKYPHSAIVCGQTGCGKTEFVLDLLESEYAGVFDNIVILCPTIHWNKAYKNRNWIGDVRKPKDKNITIVNPVMPDGTERLQELLRLFLINLPVNQLCTSSMIALPQKN